ncbi:membrane protein insertase YidC [Dermatophilus congolensis]|uniref:membrane protein insertase YidC n=2 Tax=Dermatophilus congolensis TaxID=1863 RepID=UPI001AAEDEBD|nr:membrane protein insertase YidC [Dermatophilus congolensis]MBO3143884.1 membrane protein insertase YidC [Dermatophilus congolensis]MBO3152875.1 membrane protein insertase YidC [Dermatophilus congolensis]MBO3160115.1 membrane protein insertase YidC [Dermatophilus congolensis]MBO3164160.1 membrane protein insertase YidC [Dermatophilus congolensis]MBO3177706.1 membrane protein insertase YidC [Dermatophilus congolensis]
MERSFFETLMLPLEWFVEWVLVAFHSLFSWVGMPAESGWTWALSIGGLVIVIRVLLMPLFFKQIQSSRRLQLIQPEMQKIQAKYKGKTDPESRQRMSEETMDLYRRTGTNPFASCLPILVQMPFFFALFSVLNNLGRVAYGQRLSAGPLNPQLAGQADASTLFGAPLSATFMTSHSIEAKILTIVLILLMSATTFITQHQLTMKNMPASALDNPMARQQKVMLYVFPLIFAVTGVNFPVGVLIYWFTTNVWSMGQQFWVIRRMPTPGSEAEKAFQERRRRQGKLLAENRMDAVEKNIASEKKRSWFKNNTDVSNIAGEHRDSSVADKLRQGGQRQQPRRTSRSRRK